MAYLVSATLPQTRGRLDIVGTSPPADAERRTSVGVSKSCKKCLTDMF